MNNIIKPIECSFLILDFCRPNESKLCLDSLYKYVKFPFKIIYLSNGGQQDYVLDYYYNGLIHQLILNKINSGLGYGTTDLFRFCDTKYAIYVQSDQFLRRTFSSDEFQFLTKTINSKIDDKLIKSISLSGDHTQGKYGERAHLIATDFYNSIPNKPNFGAGPYHNGEWNEGYIQKYYQENNYLHYNYDILFQDNGCYAIRQNPDGSIWRHRTDSKQLELVGGIVKEKFIYPAFTDNEWEHVISTQSWPKWRVPDREQKHCFIHFKPPEKL